MCFHSDVESDASDVSGSLIISDGGSEVGGPALEKYSPLNCSVVLVASYCTYMYPIMTRKCGMVII